MSIFECPVGCGRNRPRGKLMCGPCWAKVPHELKGRVVRAWRQVEIKNTDAAYIEYDDVRNQAIASVG